jgi:hypothetical protein
MSNIGSTNRKLPNAEPPEIFTEVRITELIQILHNEPAFRKLTREWQDIAELILRERWTYGYSCYIDLRRRVLHTEFGINSSDEDVAKFNAAWLASNFIKSERKAGAWSEVGGVSERREQESLKEEKRHREKNEDDLAEEEYESRGDWEISNPRKNRWRYRDDNDDDRS